MFRHGRHSRYVPWYAGHRPTAFLKVGAVSNDLATRLRESAHIFTFFCGFSSRETIDPSNDFTPVLR